MRTVTFLALILCTSFYAFAQDDEITASEKKNIIKLNLPALALKNISLQYERAVGKRISVGGTFRYMPKGKLPLLSTIKDIADDPDFTRQADNLKFGNYAIMPEMRFYVGKKGALHGFYIGPFVSFANYDLSLPYEYDDAGTTKTIPIAGNINAITGGLMFGAQWSLSRSISLDWWILGPNYGISNGKLSGKQSLTASEQQSLRDELNNLEIPLTDFTYEVNSNGATIDFDGPWAGLRAGICIGIKF